MLINSESKELRELSEMRKQRALLICFENLALVAKRKPFLKLRSRAKQHPPQQRSSSSSRGAAEHQTGSR